jgi:hypothetical protein
MKYTIEIPNNMVEQFVKDRQASIQTSYYLPLGLTVVVIDSEDTLLGWTLGNITYPIKTVKDNISICNHSIDPATMKCSHCKMSMTDILSWSIK